MGSMYGMPDLFIAVNSREENGVAWLNNMFRRAALVGASDVHFEDMEEDTRIRFRIGGVLQVVESIHRMRSVECVNKIRARANLPMSDLRSPLDGRFSLYFREDNLSIDVRVSLQPIIHGTSVVCRILDQRNTLRTIDDIDMSPEVRNWIDILLHEPHGLFLITGPTGSGKTSTLYALLNALHDDSRKITTIEDPVEYRVAGLCQTSIEGNLTFADALRSELRQDPDIILVGEIRDAETARIAVQASMTGHLVLSTLHANDAPATIGRMLDLGVDPNTLGAALRGVLAQRLVRKLKPGSGWAKPTESEAFWLQQHDINETDTDYGQAKLGDPDEGYEGRVPVMELLVVDRTVRNVLPMRDVKLLRTAIKRQPQYETLAVSGARLARQGLTTISEVLTVSSISENLRSLRTVPERLIELGKLTAYQYDMCKQLQQSASLEGKRLSIEDVLIMQRYVSQQDIDDVSES